MNRISPRRPARLFAFVAVCALFIGAVGCSGRPSVKMAGDTENPPPAGFDQKDSANPRYLELIDGLHVTGTPVDVDIDEYRLRISGKIARPSSFSFGEILKMDAERIEMDLECPGFFTDSGEWTGVRLSSLLNQLDVDEDASEVEFISIDGSYKRKLSLETVMNTNVLVAYEFEQRQFPAYHGFPLRIAAEGEYGSYWVKWLGSIIVN